MKFLNDGTRGLLVGIFLGVTTVGVAALVTFGAVPEPVAMALLTVIAAVCLWQVPSLTKGSD